MPAPGGGVSAPSGGCLLPGGVCLRGGVGGSAPGGCAWWRSPTATAAGGTHPTGMHSCCFCKAKKYADVMVNVDISKIFILKAIWAHKQFALFRITYVAHFSKHRVTSVPASFPFFCGVTGYSSFFLITSL